MNRNESCWVAEGRIKETRIKHEAPPSGARRTSEEQPVHAEKEAAATDEDNHATANVETAEAHCGERVPGIVVATSGDKLHVHGGGDVVERLLVQLDIDAPILSSLVTSRLWGCEPGKLSAPTT